MKPQSVLTVYRLDTPNAERLQFEDAARFVDENYGQKAVCREVLHFGFEPEQLASELDAIINDTPQLQFDLNRLREAGANYIFVAPVAGNPIEGRALV